jgi:predicted short-subunit dehydrogenase-like oxidoreductase (DUF2520 family)
MNRPVMAVTDPGLKTVGWVCSADLLETGLDPGRTGTDMLNYAIVGGGRLARHFSQYFQLLDIPHTRWTRHRDSSFNSFELPDAEQRLRKTIVDADCVLLLVSDNAIGTLLKQYPFLHEKQLVHCSGALSFPGVVGAHPLMTFADDLYQLETYQSVPFMLEAGHSFADLFPALPNQHFSISVEEKARYHAMCVMAGNFPQILWKSISDRFEQQFELPAETLHPYLKQLATNFSQQPESALTGPLVRNDVQTIERNLGALAGDPMQDLYRAFVEYYLRDDKQGGLRGQAS